MASSSMAGTSCSDSEGEEQEDPSSSLENGTEALEHLTLDDEQPLNKDSSDELTAFREQWHRELDSKASPQRETSSAPPVETTEALSEEDKAKQLFREGVELERGGKLYEAIQHYKRAMQILPDVEKRLYESAEQRGGTPEEESEQEEVVRVDEGAGSEDEDAVEGEDLLTRLQRIQARKGVLCEPDNPAKECHLSWLPYEVLALLLRWVVSSELDAPSLERLGAACRGLYVAARDPDLWRAMCLRAWGAECGAPRAHGAAGWRDMFSRRPRPLLHGCYISRTSYLRHGETSFQDHSYRPWYLVHYYRYLRFFSDGAVLLWTTAEEPAACVAQLRARRPPAGALRGHYRLLGDKVVIVARKMNEKPAQPTNTRFRSRRKETHEQHETTFHLELQLRALRGRAGRQLAWRGYSACARGGQRTPFDLAPAKFPPFAFSRVRAYAADAPAPLDWPRRSE